MGEAQGLPKLLKVLHEIEAEFPEFDIKYKRDSKLMRFIDTFLKIITFGKMKTFMTSFVTTIGDDVYVPDDWDERHPLSKAITLRHERVHIRQKQRHFRSVKWLGFLWFGLCYTMWILPAGLALGRKRYEQEAYEESLRARAEYFGVGVLDDASYRAHVVNHFLSANYFWTWPFRGSIEKWFDSAVKKIRDELGS